jgi:hypothetical protein
MYPCTSHLSTINVTERTTTRRGRRCITRNIQRPRKVTHVHGTPYYKGDNNTVEFADALFPVSCKWIRATPTQCYSLDLGLIHDTCTVHTAHTQYQGSTTDDELKAHAHAILARYSTTGEYTPPPSRHNANCSLCTHSNADVKCTTQSCTNHIHARCWSQEGRQGQECITDRVSVGPLQPNQVASLARSSPRPFTVHQMDQSLMQDHRQPPHRLV